MVAPPGFEPTTFLVRTIATPAARNFPYDMATETTIAFITRLGAGKAQRYLASDFDRLSDRLLDASEIAVVEVVETSGWQRGTARAQSVQHCSTELRKNGRGEFT